jgi:hypothetical protein
MTEMMPATGTVGCERTGGQGLDANQEESGNAAIMALLTSEEGRAATDLVITCRVADGGATTYEAWAERGMVGWVRRYAERGYTYEVVEACGENPLERQDVTALSTLAEELAAAGNPQDVQRAFIEPAQLTYPYAYERIAQLFDSPNAPDIIVSPKSYAYGRQPGQHGALDVVQSRSPLIFSGPGVKRGVVAAEARQIDVAPTICRLMGFPLIDGMDGSGRTSSERGITPDVYLKRQDGRVLDEVLDDADGRPERVYILLLDGQSQTELLHRLESDPTAVPNLRRLIENGVMLQHGSITNFPSITWPSHNAIGTGAWCGHHDIVNPTYYLRAQRETISPQGMQFDTAKYLGDGVETLFEAFHRVYGEWDGMQGAFTASIIEPCVRGADHATLERRLVGDRGELIALTQETDHEISPRWVEELEEHGHKMMGQIDNRGLAQARQLFRDQSHPTPKLVFHEFSQPDSAAHDYGPHHEGARQALDETDLRIGHILDELDSLGLFDSTLFVVTTDHGMATTDVELRGNPARIPERHGMAAVTCEPCIWLRDVAVTIEVASDGRTARVEVLDNDADTTGERPPVAGATIRVVDSVDGHVATTHTGADGLAAFAIPADLLPAELALSAQAEHFNTRHLRLDGTNISPDPHSLYAQSAG